MGQLAPSLIAAAGDIGASAFAPSPYQEMHPYAGSGSANGTMADVQALLHMIAPGIIDKASQDVTLPDAVVHNVDPVGGFSLGDVGSLSKAPTLPGLKFDTKAIDFPSTHDTSTQQQVDDAGVVDHSIGGQLRKRFGPAPTEDSGGMIQRSAAPIRNKFAATNYPSAMQQGDPQDPTSAALHLLRSAIAA